MAPNHTASEVGHVPVLAEQVADLLDLRAGHVLLDCTVGRGGHAQHLIPRLYSTGRYIGLDLDPVNVMFSRQRLAHFSVDVHIQQANFILARHILDALGIVWVDRVLADLGFASNQMEDLSRGFSFANDGPLDMRFDPSGPTTAADLLRRLDERSLADLIYRYGEERLSRKIARKIVEQRSKRPIQSTKELARIVREAYGRRAGMQKVDPATRTFMALRIAVNGELESLEQLLTNLTAFVRPGGIVAVISFHSLEDRLVKHGFLALERRGLAERLNRKPLIADQAERRQNPRCRSAKLRAVRIIGSTVPLGSPSHLSTNCKFSQDSS